MRKHRGQEIYPVSNIIMVELILLIIVLVSLFGMGVILYRKMPALVNLPESPENLPQFSEMVRKARERSKEGVKKISAAGGRIDHELYLQKILSKIRILTLKTENKTAFWLERLRRKRTNQDQQDYWQELKKAKQEDKPA